jgi:hypothetical protein
VNDLAKSGAGIFCNRELPAHAGVVLSISVPGRANFILKGRIVWRQDLPVLARAKYQYGIRLLGDLAEYGAFLSAQTRCECELRRRPRYPDVLIARKVEVQDLIDAAVTNVSAGGFFLRTDHSLDAGRQCEVELQNDYLPEPLCCLGEVVDTFAMDADAFMQQFGAGVRILAFHGDSQARFAQYLNGLESLYSLYWRSE